MVVQGRKLNVVVRVYGNRAVDGKLSGESSMCRCAD